MSILLRNRLYLSLLLSLLKILCQDQVFLLVRLLTPLGLLLCDFLYLLPVLQIVLVAFLHPLLLLHLHGLPNGLIFYLDLLLGFVLSLPDLVQLRLSALLDLVFSFHEPSHSSYFL